MPWQNKTRDAPGDIYYYTTKILKCIATHYINIYDGLPLTTTELITDPNVLAEYSADFDNALRAIGTGKWDGKVEDKSFKDYRRYGRLQRIIIADIMGVEDYELEGIGFWDIPRLRGYGYYLMCKSLNGGCCEQ